MDSRKRMLDRLLSQFDDKRVVSALLKVIAKEYDYQHQLRNVEVTYKEGDSITLYLSGYSNYSGYGDIYISSYSGINVAESNTWNLTPAIPEYTSAVLSLLALSALGMRRRRK